MRNGDVSMTTSLISITEDQLAEFIYGLRLDPGSTGFDCNDQVTGERVRVIREWNDALNGYVLTFVHDE